MNAQLKEYLSPEELIHTLVETVSCGGKGFWLITVRPESKTEAKFCIEFLLLAWAKRLDTLLKNLGYTLTKALDIFTWNLRDFYSKIGILYSNIGNFRSITGEIYSNIGGFTQILGIFTQILGILTPLGDFTQILVLLTQILRILLKLWDLLHKIWWLLLKFW